MLCCIAAEVFADDLVVESFSSPGDVTLFKGIFSENISIQISTNASWFDCNYSGNYVLKESGKWYCGDIKTLCFGRDSRSVIHAPSDNPRFARISACGSMIAWIDRLDKSYTIYITLSRGNRDEPVRNFTTNGVISDVSWSPEDPIISFYYGGGANVVTEGGFSLMSMDVTETNIPSTLAGPSLQTRLTPARDTPPQWAPNGKRIIFEARYSSADYFSGFYLYNFADHSKQSIGRSGGIWVGDREDIFSVKRFTDDGGAVFSKMNLSTEAPPNIDDNCEIVVPPCSMFTISPDESMIAYINNSEVFVVDIRSGKVLKIGKARASTELHWIR